MNENKVCPNCVEELSYEHRTLGLETEFFVCLGCGYREVKEEDIIEVLNIENNEENRNSEDYYSSSQQDVIYELIQQKDSI